MTSSVQIRVKWKRALLLVGAMGVPILIGAAAPQVIDRVRTWTTTATAPLLELQGRAARFLETKITELSEIPVLKARSARLEADVQKLKSELAGLDELKQEKARLESLLNLKETRYLHAVAARVIRRDPSHWSRTIVINKGTHEAVADDTVLIHPDGLVGKVISAGPFSSRAILLTDGESRVSAMNQRTRDIGLIEGTGTLLLKMTYLDRDANLQVGDTIVSSGLGGIYPKGIRIGEVQMIGRDDGELRLYAIVRPFVSFSKLEEVLVVKGST